MWSDVFNVDSMTKLQTILFYFGRRHYDPALRLWRLPRGRRFAIDHWITRAYTNVLCVSRIRADNPLLCVASRHFGEFYRMIVEWRSDGMMLMPNMGEQENPQKNKFDLDRHKRHWIKESQTKFGLKPGPRVRLKIWPLSLLQGFDSDGRWGDDDDRWRT